MNSSNHDELSSRIKMEAAVRAERCSSIEVTASGIKPFCLACIVDTDLLKFKHIGRLKSILYRASAESGSTEESTVLRIGGLVE